MLRWINWLVVFCPTLIWLAFALRDVSWWTENIVAFPSLFLVSYLVFALVFSLFRQWAHAISCLMFSVVFWLLTPVSQQKLTSECANPIRVGQFNTFYGNSDINQVLNFLLSQELDLVVLQEVAPEVGERLKTLSDVYPFQYGGQTGVGYPSSQMILSQTELTNMSVFMTPDQQAVIKGKWRPSKHQAFTLITAHPPSPRSKELWYRRNALIRTIASLTVEYPNDETLIVGDFNLSSISLRYSKLFPEFQSAPVASWPKWSVDVKTPAWTMISIDHLWLKSTERKICQRQSLDTPNGSDHKFVLTQIGY